MSNSSLLIVNRGVLLNAAESSQTILSLELCVLRCAAVVGCLVITIWPVAYVNYCAAEMHASTNRQPALQRQDAVLSRTAIIVYMLYVAWLI
jgi:hypothetical protein